MYFLASNVISGEEPPESLFMKELRRRGMTPTSLLEDTNTTEYGVTDETRKEGRAFSQRNAVSTEVEKSLSDQRERSMKLNSEGLEVDPFCFSFVSCRIVQAIIGFRSRTLLKFQGNGLSYVFTCFRG